MYTSISFASFVTLYVNKLLDDGVAISIMSNDALQKNAMLYLNDNKYVLPVDGSWGGYHSLAIAIRAELTKKKATTNLDNVKTVKKDTAVTNVAVKRVAPVVNIETKAKTENKRTTKDDITDMIDGMNVSSPEYRFIKKMMESVERGIEFDLRPSQHKQIDNATTCAYTGAPLTSTAGQANSRTFERIDPTKGYVDGNVVAVTNAINKFKGETVDRLVHFSGKNDNDKKLAKKFLLAALEQIDND